MCSILGDYSLNDRLITFSIILTGKVCVLDKLIELYSLVGQNFFTYCWWICITFIFLWMGSCNSSKVAHACFQNGNFSKSMRYLFLYW